jgi:hypothetical protein
MQLLSLIAFVASATALAVPTPNLEERATCANANVLGLARAKQEFTEAKLVPDLVPEFKPTLEVHVDYNGKAVDFGNTFNTLGKTTSELDAKPIETRLTPHIETTPEPNFSITRELLYNPSTTKYTLIMADPDAPNPAAPILKDFLHWIMSDVQPKCITNQKRKTVHVADSVVGGRTPLHFPGLPPTAELRSASESQLPSWCSRRLRSECLRQGGQARGTYRWQLLS